MFDNNLSINYMVDSLDHEFEIHSFNSTLDTQYIVEREREREREIWYVLL
jgi:hypothetical protein